MCDKELENEIVSIIKDILSEKGKKINIDKDYLNKSIYEDGLGLDSMSTAVLSVKLEEKFGFDPYSEGEFPRTINELIGFYKKVKK